ncbi:hypothetical protein TNCT_468991 [Trichonephila clavata]|uniref:Uncharacterized protein n=1 Tax=Trichonephila clavata TaxID=2740835 RepID=A0A8X6HTM0_TRICU|nr:hypothetical protein TNCT_468991 [Trichonephila clavata]
MLVNFFNLKKKWRSCDDYSDAWGSDSKVCLDKPEPCNRWFDHKELTKKSTNNRFAYHTCEVSWRCGFSASKMPVVLRLTPEPNLFIALPNGTLVLETDFFHLSRDTSVSIAEKPIIKETRMDAKCVKEKDAYWCIDSDTNYGFYFQRG